MIHQIYLVGQHLGCGGTGDSHHRYANLHQLTGPKSQECFQRFAKSMTNLRSLNQKSKFSENGAFIEPSDKCYI